MDNFNHTLTQPFYNTIHLSEIDWEIENEKALGMQKIIQRIFLANVGVKISPWQMRKYLADKQNKKVNINSVRRCMSNLKNEDILTKTADMRMGDEGKEEHFYILGKQPELEYKKGKKTVGDIASSIIETTKKQFIQTEIF